LNRTAATAQKLAREAKAKTFRKDQLAKTTWDVILNATPIGMTGFKTQSWLEPNEINARIVFDMVYDPVETPLLRMARHKGSTVITGLEMFVYQGAEQFQIWSGKPAPRDEMLRIVVHAAQVRAEALRAANPAEYAKAEKAFAAAALAAKIESAKAAKLETAKAAKAAPIAQPPPEKTPAKPPVKAAVKAPAKPASKPAPKPAPKLAKTPAKKSASKPAKRK
jgi:3-dehydroquinate dehydratase/shikimate dehydrogenase